MKRRICAIPMIFLLTLTGCGRSQPPEIFVVPTPAVNLQETLEELENSGEQATPEPEKTPLAAMMTGGTEIPLYENFLWSSKWTEDGWLSADGMSVNFQFELIRGEFPEVTYGKDLEISCAEGATVSHLSVYDEAFEEINGNSGNLQILEELPEGIYYLVFNVKKQGEYIESENKHEMNGFECICKLVVPKEEK